MKNEVVCFICLIVLNLLCRTESRRIAKSQLKQNDPSQRNTRINSNSRLVTDTPTHTPDNQVFPARDIEEDLHMPVPVSKEEENIANSISNKLFEFTRPTFNERYGLALPGFYLKRSVQFLEFLFILDSSGSIGSTNFNKIKDTAKTLVDYVDYKSPISTSGSKIGLIEFSSPAKTTLEFRFSDYNTTSTIKSAINRVAYDAGSSTGTGTALNLAKTQFKPNGPTLSNITNVIWLVTDGVPNTPDSPIFPARQLKEDLHVRICIVFIGNTASLSEVNAIASPQCVFHVKSVSSYQRIIQFAYKKRLRNYGDGYAQTISPNFFS